MRHVFISYSKKNRAYARKLADALIYHGFDVWIDDRIDYGEDWWRVITKAIRECSAFIVIMTPESDKSKWVQREVTLADNLNKPIFPFLLTGENWDIFVRIQYVNVIHGDLPPRSFYERLLQVVPCNKYEGKNIHDEYYDENQNSVSLQEKTESFKPLNLGISSFPLLVAWNPLHHLLLWWWLFFDPQKIVLYKQIYGENSVIHVGSWLVSDISWLPIFIPLLSHGTNEIRFDDTNVNNSVYVLLVLLVLFLWIATGIFGDLTGTLNGSTAFVISGIISGISVGIMAGNGLFIITSIVAGSISFILAGEVAENAAVGTNLAISFVIIAVELSSLWTGIAIGLAEIILYGITIDIAGNNAASKGIFLVFIGMMTLASFMASSLLVGIVMGAIFIGLSTIYYVITTVIKESVNNPRFVVLAKIIALLQVITYATMFWFYWLDGWKILP